MKPSIVYFYGLLCCSAAAVTYRDVLIFIQKMRAPQKNPNVDFEEYFRLVVPNHTVHRAVEAMYLKYLEQFCFSVQDFMKMLNYVPDGVLQPLNLSSADWKVDLRSWEIVAFFEKSSLRKEYYQCLQAWKKMSPLFCIDCLIYDKLGGLHAFFATQSFYYLKIAKRTAREGTVGSFLTNFRPVINGDYLQELTAFLWDRMELIEVDRKTLVAELTYAMCMFTHIEYQAAYLQRFDLCKRAIAGTEELQNIFKKLKTTLVHERELPTVFKVTVKGELMDITKIQIVSVPQRTRVKRELVYFFYSLGVLKVTLPEYKCSNSTVDAVIQQALEYLKTNREVAENPTLIPLQNN